MAKRMARIEPINLIVTTPARHLIPSLRKDFSIIELKKNNDGKRVFPDGEVYARFEGELLKGRVVIIHAGSPRPNDGIVELEMALAVLRRAGVPDIEVFFTYFPYGMQDKIFQEGETNAAEDLLMKLCEYWKVKRVYAIDPHFHGASWLQKFPFVSVPAHDLLVAAARIDYPEAVFVAPDMGHEHRTKKVKGFKKTRTDSYTVTIEHDKEFMGSFFGKSIGVTDDIIETGNTMVKFHDECKEYGAKELFAVATHGALLEGVKKVKEKYKNLYLSNTIDREEANVDISPLIIEALTK